MIFALVSFSLIPKMYFFNSPTFILIILLGILICKPCALASGEAQEGVRPEEGSSWRRIKSKLFNGNLTPDCIGIPIPTPHCVSALIWRNVKEAVQETHKVLHPK